MQYIALSKRIKVVSVKFTAKTLSICNNCKSLARDKLALVATDGVFGLRSYGLFSNPINDWRTSPKKKSLNFFFESILPAENKNSQINIFRR